jgi:hypothetical protein
MAACHHAHAGYHGHVFVLGSTGTGIGTSAY